MTFVRRYACAAHRQPHVPAGPATSKNPCSACQEPRRVEEEIPVPVQTVRRSARLRRALTKRLFKAQHGKCAICGYAMWEPRDGTPKMATLQGGTAARPDLRAVCLACNHGELP